MASSFGQVADQAFLASRPAPRAPVTSPSSRLSSPAIADDSAAASLPSRLVPGRPPWSAGVLVLAMAPHLLPQPVGHPAGQVGHACRVDPARPGPGYVVFLDHPAGPAAQQDHAVAEPRGLADVVRDEQD